MKKKKKVKRVRRKRISKIQVIAVARKLAEKENGIPILANILLSFGAKRISEIPRAKFEPFLRKMNSLMSSRKPMFCSTCRHRI